VALDGAGLSAEGVRDWMVREVEAVGRALYGTTGASSVEAMFKKLPDHATYEAAYNQAPTEGLEKVLAAFIGPVNEQNRSTQGARTRAKVSALLFGRNPLWSFAQYMGAIFVKHRSTAPMMKYWQYLGGAVAKAPSARGAAALQHRRAGPRRCPEGETAAAPAHQLGGRGAHGGDLGVHTDYLVEKF
jgi:hypothetical protein